MFRRCRSALSSAEQAAQQPTESAAGTTAEDATEYVAEPTTGVTRAACGVLQQSAEQVAEDAWLPALAVVVAGAEPPVICFAM